MGNTANTRSCAVVSTKIAHTWAFSTLALNVSGSASVIDNFILEISVFNFDGAVSNVRFNASVNTNFSDSNVIVIGESTDGRSYSNEVIILVLPEVKFDDFDSLSVWCVGFREKIAHLHPEEL